MLYITPFILAFILSVILTGVLVIVNRFTKVLIRKKEYKRPTVSVPRLGGIAIIITFILTLSVDQNLILDRQWLVLLMVVLMTVVVGLLDDLWILSWRAQLFAQIFIAIFLFSLDIRIDIVSNPFGGIINLDNTITVGSLALGSLLVTIIWTIALTNAMNWLDGVDGLGAVVAIVGAGAIFAVSLLPQVNQPPVAIVAVTLIGATLGFLVYNWQPASITAGTSGSFFWGLMIAMLAMFADAKIATALLVMTIPIVDALWVIGERLFAGESVFTPDKRHLHHKLLSCGFKPWMIAILYGVITSFLAFGAINFDTMGKLMTIVITSILLLSLLALLHKIVSKKTKLI